ncbi:hypothetical protein AVEN_220241-1 [Araneus ventricosus]|uniref:Uncharacterized protein n=2 Tax=Araneus ventricosus TaxID=182803 RepID=A0A4Y2HFH5_ARAVE|nr:hypothetical protein AVEN_220241-1 [Araneus ventricosus]
MKDVETLTDAFACGDTKRVMSQASNSPQHTLGDCAQTDFQHPTNPFLDLSVDLPAEREPSNPFVIGISSHQVPLLLYQGENEYRPEIDPASFDVDEPELIEIFQNSKNSFTLLDNPCPQDFANNPFLVTNPFKLKSTNPFKGSLNEIANPFGGVLNELENCVRNTPVSRKNDGFTTVVSHPKVSLKRKENTVMSCIKSRGSGGNSPRCQKLN